VRILREPGVVDVEERARDLPPLSSSGSGGRGENVSDTSASLGYRVHPIRSRAQAERLARFFLNAAEGPRQKETTMLKPRNKRLTPRPMKETQIEKRLRKQLISTMGALRVADELRNTEAVDAAKLLIEERQRREQVEAWWTKKVREKEDEIALARKESALFDERTLSLRYEIERLERVVIEQAKLIFIAKEV
jgi:hypothetical protein